MDDESKMAGGAALPASPIATRGMPRGGQGARAGAARSGVAVRAGAGAARVGAGRGGARPPGRSSVGLVGLFA